MSKSLEEIAEELKKNAEKSKHPKKVQIIYAFNGTGKTRLSMEFKKLVSPKTILEKEIAKENENLKKFEENLEKAKRPEGKNKLNEMIEGIKGNIRDKENELSNPPDSRTKILYYNALTEDLFYWNNENQDEFIPVLKIQDNTFINWILHSVGGDSKIVSYFQKYINNKLSPKFKKSSFDINEVENIKDNEVTFSYGTGDIESEKKIKISKGEENTFVWSVFYTLIENILDELEEDSKFKDLEYVFVDDPVSSLDDNHLIELAIDLAKLIKDSKSDNIKFIITTHNPLFYNVLWNEFKNNKYASQFILEKIDGNPEVYNLKKQNNDSPFAYHLYLKNEIERAINTDTIQRFHFNLLRNILEKTANFLGYDKWGDLLPKDPDGSNPTEVRLTRMINLYNHSSYSSEDAAIIKPEEKMILRNLINHLNNSYGFNQKLDIKEAE